MKKCPRCQRKVSDHDKYCPHCGYNLNKPMFNYKTIWIMFLFSFVIIPLLYTFILTGGDISRITNNNTSDKIVLEEVAETDYKAVAYQFNSLDEFKYKVSDADTYIKKIEDYEQELKNKVNLEYTSSYNIIIYNNYDVSFELNYLFDLDNNVTLSLNKTFTRSGTDDETYIFTQSGISELSDIKINEYAKQYLEDEVIDTMYNHLLDRENDFNEKKDNIGHLGYGEYENKGSLVVYPDSDLFKVVLKCKG